MQGLYTRHLSEKANSDSTMFFEGTLSFLMGSVDGKSQESAILFCLIDFAYFDTLLIEMDFRHFHAFNHQFGQNCLHFVDDGQIANPGPIAFVSNII